MSIADLDLRSNCRFVQFQLWRDCPNNCDFCYNKSLINPDKLKILPQIIDKLQDPLMDKFNEFGLIGGELFGHELDDPEVKRLFYQITDNIVARIERGQVNKLYVTSALLFKDLSNLWEFIEYLDQRRCLKHLLLCTSYDTLYRFKNERSEQLWSDNMMSLIAGGVNVHTETILTNHFIKQVLANKFSIKDFEQQFGKLNFIQPQCNTNCATKAEFVQQLPDFLPERLLFLKFLHKVHAEQLINLDEFLNENLHSDLLYLEHNGYLYEFMGRRRWPSLMDAYYRDIGRNFYHLGYADSDIKMESDVQAFKEMVS